MKIKCQHCNLEIEYLDYSIGSKRWYHKHNDSRYCCNTRGEPEEEEE